MRPTAEFGDGSGSTNGFVGFRDADCNAESSLKKGMEISQQINQRCSS
jgi:hypothetical protein